MHIILTFFHSYNITNERNSTSYSFHYY
jgi:hypothetical protein